MGNLFADLVRITTRILLPLSIVGGLLLVWQGVPQNFEGNVVVETLEGTFQVIAMGPIAALETVSYTHLMCIRDRCWKLHFRRAVHRFLKHFSHEKCTINAVFAPCCPNYTIK